MMESVLSNLIQNPLKVQLKEEVTVHNDYISATVLID